MSVGDNATCTIVLLSACCCVLFVLGDGDFVLRLVLFSFARGHFFTCSWYLFSLKSFFFYNHLQNAMIVQEEHHAFAYSSVYTFKIVLGCQLLIVLCSKPLCYFIAEQTTIHDKMITSHCFCNTHSIHCQ